MPCLQYTKNQCSINFYSILMFTNVWTELDALKTNNIIISGNNRFNNIQYQVWHDFNIVLNIKTKNMKNQKKLSFMATWPDELKSNRKKPSPAKKPTYIYTEEDLGEGILEAGI